MDGLARAYRALRDAGATWAEIARETGHDWRTVKKYLSPDAPDRPPAVTACRPTKNRIAERRYLSEGSMAKLYEKDNDGAETKEVGTTTKELLPV